jgi:hypothetical protein
MKRRATLLLPLALTSGSFFFTYSALAQLITNTVGTFSCSPFKDASGTPCYQLKCNPSPDSYTN